MKQTIIGMDAAAVEVGGWVGEAAPCRRDNRRSGRIAVHHFLMGGFRGCQIQSMIHFQINPQKFPLL